MKTIAASLLILSITVNPPSLHAEGKSLHSGFPPGSYTGAGQIMEISSNGVPTFRDNLGICHIEIASNDRLQANFPVEDTTNGEHFRTVLLEVTAVDPRITWTARCKNGTLFKVTAIPYSAEQYVFRLEVLRDRKLVAGGQEFYSFCTLNQRKETH